MKQRLVTIITSIVALLGASALIVTLLVQSVTSQQQNQLISTLSADNDALRGQVIDSGEKPVAPPAQERIDDANLPGPQGPAGVDGQDGKNGRSVAAVFCQASDARWVIVYDDGSRQTVDGPCVAQNGADGATGAQGPSGATGPSGADGQPPTSWQFEWAHTTYTCTRDDPFDASAPTYTCNP